MERTHPDALYQVVTQTPGKSDPKSETETIVSTGTHPFYVANRHAFVPAQELLPIENYRKNDGNSTDQKGRNHRPEKDSQ